MMSLISLPPAILSQRRHDRRLDHQEQRHQGHGEADNTQQPEQHSRINGRHGAHRTGGRS